MTSPLLYKLKLSIIPSEETFKGTLTILTTPTTQITLDSLVEVNNVYINKTPVPFTNGPKLTISSKTIFTLVRIDFTGKIRSSLSGLYRSNDTLVTCFEPNDARKVFPCFDSPNHKAVFKFSISVPKGVLVVFNTPLASKVVDDFVTYTFKYTPLMSSYLVAFAIGKFDALEEVQGIHKVVTYSELLEEEGSSEEDFSLELVNYEEMNEGTSKFMNEEIKSEGSALGDSIKEESNEMRILVEWSKKKEKKETKLRIYTERGQAEESKFALSITPSLIKNLSSFFDYPFPLEKLDQISLKKFGMGAMENFGLITYWESLLLFTKESNPSFQAHISETVAHELVHQWFGNLVTPSSWEDLWLNEGFATFLSNLILDSYPYTVMIDNKPSVLEYDFMNDFTAQAEGGLFLDSLSSHPIISKENPEEIFDEITYQKASSVIKMMFNKEALLNLKKYIKKYSYKSVKSEDILGFLGIEENIKEWLYEKHYPLLTVREVEGGIHISQEVFTLLEPNTNSESSNTNSNNKEENSGSNKETNNKETVWKVPLVFGKTEFLLSEKEAFIPISLNENNIQPGFFRVFYPNLENYKKVTISTVNDLYALLLKGKINLEEYKEVVNQSSYEEYHCFESVVGQLTSLIKKVNIDSQILLRILNQKGEEKSVNGMKREALRLKMLLLMNQEVEIPDSYFFKTAKFIKKVKNGNYEEVLDKYFKSKVPDERTACLFALFSSNTLGEIIKSFGLLVSGKIPVSDAPYCFAGLYHSRLVNSAYEMVLGADLVHVFGDDKTLLGDCLGTFFTNVPLKFVERVRIFLDGKGFEQKKSVVLECIMVDEGFRKRLKGN